MSLGIPFDCWASAARTAEVRAAYCNFTARAKRSRNWKAFSPKALPKPQPQALSAICLWRYSRTIPGRPEPDMPEDVVQPTEQAWQQMQDELAQLSTKSTHVIARTADITFNSTVQTW